ncbi:DUF2336 domain-containing protein [Rhizobium sp. FKY42]|uniref:DUF2336 domain-containing protein n=1 Tax=Rhizobium sp. FKY42 TaxID=2562310 RepID=UPI001FEF19C6|nr:DUF2336 domain-containing protein [Rhizobium sp. FKY42]
MSVVSHASVDMSVDRYRELEKPQALRKKDVVLMATVTSFEDLKHPTKSELRQFAELFSPLYTASSEEARRQAVSALSQCEQVPSSVAFFIASQPIAIAAPFLMASPCLNDDQLIAIARCQGAEHARAIVRRPALSPAVIDALVSMRHARLPTSAKPDKTPVDKAPIAEKPATPAPSMQQPPSTEAAQAAQRDEALRQKIKQLAAMQARPTTDRLGLRTATDVQEALMVRFARSRDADAFATCLADTLSASRWLAERIMMDISGLQLATTLKALGMDAQEAFFILERLYNHLKEAVGGVSRGEILWDSLQDDECIRRLEAWCRADRYTYADKDDMAETEQTTAAANDAGAQQVIKLKRA